MPDWTKEIVRALEPLELRPEREREIADELATHLEDRYCEALGHGAGEQAARTVALAELSDVLVPELRRVEQPWHAVAPLGSQRRGPLVGQLSLDLRYALRSLRLSPGFTVVSLLTLAIGIGACTLMLSAVSAVLLRPLPYRNPEQLVTFWGTAPEKGLPEVAYPTGLAALYRERAHTLESFAAYTGGYGFNLSGKGDAEHIEGAAVSAEFFHVLGVAPMLGRVPLVAEADRHGAARVAVLSHSLWMRHFGGDSSVIGRPIDLSGAPATVVGVMPAGFDFPDRSDLWVPLYLEPSAFNCWCYNMIGRMRPGVRPDDVRGDIASVTDVFAISRQDIFPGAKPGGTRIVAMPLTQRLVGSVERQLLILLAAVACVLLIACANIANLLLARTARRVRELAVRCCLGASPSRIATQLLTESVLLSFGGAAIGAVLAAWGTSALRQLPTKQFPRIDQVRVDPTVLAVTIGVALFAGILCGLVPAWRATRVDLQDAIKSGIKGSDARSSRRTSNSFVVAQFALSLVLLVAAGLLLRSYERLARVTTGYHTDDVLTARVGVPWPRYDSAGVVRVFYQRLVEQVRALPDVRAVGVASQIPLTGGNTQDNIIAEGREPLGPNEPVRVANVRLVTPGYFDAIGTPLLRGRGVLASDDEHAPHVAVIDELFAKHFWPGEDPIGKRFYHGGDTASTRLITVVGVVANVKHSRLDEPGDLQEYQPFAQFVYWDAFLVVRTTSQRVGLVGEIRRAMKAIDPSVPLYDVRTMREAVDQSLGTRRLTDVLLAGFSLTALVLAAIGIYGVMSLGVNGRLREFGIRLALGAKPGTVRGLVLWQASWLAFGGVLIGLIGALATTRYLRTLLFGVGPLDWLTFVGVAVLLTATALIASYLPARRATKADPILALKAE